MRLRKRKQKCKRRKAKIIHTILNIIGKKDFLTALSYHISSEMLKAKAKTLLRVVTERCRKGTFDIHIFNIGSYFFVLV